MKRTILEFIAEILQEEISPGQRVFLKALYGLKMDAEEKGLFRQFTGREDPPTTRQEEATAICGRRSGKTGRLGIPVALYEATLGGHEKHLGKSETGHVVLVAQSKDITLTNTMNTLRTHISLSPLLRRMVAEETKHQVTFTNRMAVSVWACTFKATRGLHIPVAILDEIGFWEVEGVNPDAEVIASIRPAAATFPHSMLLKLSTPWSKFGALWDDWTHWWGKAGGPLVWKAKTREMNPSVPLEFLVREYERDPEKARREYDAEFLDPVDSFIPSAVIQQATDKGVTERAPEPEPHYEAAVDIAFKTDATVLAIGHRKGDTVIVDVWRDWRPAPGKPLKLDKEGADPGMAYEVAVKCRYYRCHHVVGDQYASEPVRQALRRHNVAFTEIAFTSSRADRETPDERRELGASKMDIYGNMKTLLLQNRVRLPDNKVGLDELRNLEVKRTWSGYEQVGARADRHDDYAAALALLCWRLLRTEEGRDTKTRIVQKGNLLLDATVEVEDPDDARIPAALRTPVEEPVAAWGGVGKAWNRGKWG